MQQLTHIVCDSYRTLCELAVAHYVSQEIIEVEIGRKPLDLYTFMLFASSTVR